MDPVSTPVSTPLNTDAFRLISVALSIVLGLGITRLLGASVAVFRTRHLVALDWQPLAWAGCIFIWQLQFWWAIIELPALVGTWTLAEFLFLLALPLLLFLAAALVLPPAELPPGASLALVFATDGRWALVPLAVYFVVATIADALFWGLPFLSLAAGLNALLAALPLAFLATPGRGARAAITLAYVALTLVGAWYQSPAEY
jgi:hypothetical protein